MPISVLIADDHPILLRGLSDLIQSDERYKVVSQAENGAKALHDLKELKPDVAVLDIVMPELSGLDVVREANKGTVNTEFIILTGHSDEKYFNQAMNLGVKGYLLKPNATDLLMECLRAVTDGKFFVAPEFSRLLIQKREKTVSFMKKYPQAKELTPAEWRILKLVSENKTNKEIAGELFLSHKTVENYKYNISAKLGLKGRNRLLRFVVENRVVL